MKKWMKFFLVFLFTLPLAVQAGDYSYSTDNNTITITRYNGSDWAVSIPATIDSLPVVCIGDDAFSHCDALTSVTIPSSVMSIGDSAFFGCSGLTSVTIPSSVTNIGNFAFMECSSLIAITVAEENLTYSSLNGVLFNFEKTTLIHCPSGLTGAYTIPNSVTSVGKYAFSRRYGLTRVNIPSSVTNLGRAAFHGCYDLTQVNIPNGVTNIGWCVFGSCFRLSIVTIPSSVTTISASDNPFDFCYALTAIYFEGNAPDVDFGPFSTSLKDPIVYRVADATGWPEVPNRWYGRRTGLWAPDSDEDTDGLPARWELEYFGNTTNVNANEVCSNGINTMIQAYVAGLNPTDPQSRLQISDFRSLPAEKTFGWTTASGRVYSVYWSTNLRLGFQCLESNISWTRGVFTNSTTVPQGYYKIDVRLAP
jgi:hypothetical protein